MSSNLKGWLVIGGIVGVVVLVAAFQQDDIDQLIEHRGEDGYVEQYRSDFTTSCIDSARKDARTMGVTISSGAIVNYCDCAYDWVIQRLDEADLRAADQGHFTDHTAAIMQEATDRCLFHIENGIQF